MRSVQSTDSDRYARCISASKRVRWDIDEDVIRGRSFDRSQKYLPDGLSLVSELTTLASDEKRFVSQIQGRTYANIFGLVERFITAKVLEVSHDHWLGDQSALEALVRFSDEELKHQELFRRIDDLIGETLPAGYRFDVDPDAVAGVVLGKSTWAVLALTLDIELFTQLHYRQSIEPDGELSELFKDVFLHHWKEESQHAILDELEWKRHDAGLTAEERDRGVDEFIELVGAVDGILRAQAAADAGYFAATLRARGRRARRRRRSRRVSGRPTDGSTSTPGRRTRGSEGAVQPDHRRPGTTHRGGARRSALRSRRGGDLTMRPVRGGTILIGLSVGLAACGGHETPKANEPAAGAARDVRTAEVVRSGGAGTVAVPGDGAGPEAGRAVRPHARLGGRAAVRGRPVGPGGRGRRPARRRRAPRRRGRRGGGRERRRGRSRRARRRWSRGAAALAASSSR